MDRVFGASEVELYERWLGTPAGRAYVEASRLLLDRVLDWRRGWRVLEVGCGLGVHLGPLLERGMLVTGLEAGPVMARLAAERLGPRAEVEVGDAHDLPFEDNSFDAVILVNTLELVERPAQVLAEASRVAASRLCVVSLNALSPTGLLRLWPGWEHPLYRGRALSLWTLWRLVREVLGPVPQTWAGASGRPVVMAGRWPFSTLMAVCAAVTPRLMTTPLVVEAPMGARAATPAAGHGRVVLLRRDR